MKNTTVIAGAVLSLIPAVALGSPSAEVDQYHFLVKNNATLVQLCAQAMTVRASYQLARDSEGYQKWSRIMGSDKLTHQGVCENRFGQNETLQTVPLYFNMIAGDGDRQTKAYWHKAIDQFVVLASDGIYSGAVWPKSK